MLNQRCVSDEGKITADLVNQRRTSDVYTTTTQCVPNVCTTTTQRIPNVMNVWNTLGSLCTNVAGSLRIAFYGSLLNNLLNITY